MHNGQYVTLKRNGSNEPVCPACHRDNAMLQTTFLGTGMIRECRDCHLIVLTTGTSEEGRVIARSLGRQCGCGSFDLEEVREPGGRQYLMECQACNKRTQF